MINDINTVDDFCQVAYQESWFEAGLPTIPTITNNSKCLQRVILVSPQAANSPWQQTIGEMISNRKLKTHKYLSHRNSVELNHVFALLCKCFQHAHLFCLSLTPEIVNFNALLRLSMPDKLLYPT